MLYDKKLSELSPEQLKNPDEIKKVLGEECPSYTISYFPPNHNEIITKKFSLCDQDEVNAGAAIIVENEKLKGSQVTKSR